MFYDTTVSYQRWRRAVRIAATARHAGNGGIGLHAVLDRSDIKIMFITASPRSRHAISRPKNAKGLSKPGHLRDLVKKAKSAGGVNRRLLLRLVMRIALPKTAGNSCA